MNILTGVHGLPSGRTISQIRFYLDDLIKFNDPRVLIWDFDAMTTGQITTMLNGPQTTFAGFCYSGICVKPYMNHLLP